MEDRDESSVRLLDPKVARAFYEWMMGLWVFAAIFVGDANLDRFQRWLWGTPQEQQEASASPEDPALIEHLKQERIHLEVCPTSNVQADIYNTYPDHPINSLYEAGLSLSVNSDTRTLTDITLTQEYERLHDIFGWEETHFLQCNLHALHASFLPEDVKLRLEKQLRNGYQS